MSLTTVPAAPYAAAVHSVELDDFGLSFRPVAPGPFTCPTDVEELVRLDERDELRALVRSPASVRSR